MNSNFFVFASCCSTPCYGIVLKVQHMLLHWFCSTWLSAVNLHETNWLQENTDLIVMRSGWEDWWFKGSLRYMAEILTFACHRWNSYLVVFFLNSVYCPSNHHFRYWRGKIKIYLNHLPQAQLKSNTSSPCLCSLSFPCFHQELYSAPAISFIKLTGHTRGWAHAHFLVWCSSFLSGCHLVLWAGQCHYSWWHWVTVPSGMCLFQLGSSVELIYFRGVPALAGLACQSKSLLRQGLLWVCLYTFSVTSSGVFPRAALQFLICTQETSLHVSPWTSY